MTSDAPLPAFMRREAVQDMVAVKVAEETRRCTAICERFFREQRELRPNAAKIALLIRAAIENGDPGF